MLFMNKYEASVVITTVDRKNDLKRAIDSVYLQDIDDLEIVVVIDGANEEIYSMLKKYNGIIVIMNMERCGGAESRNIGIRNATKRWVALLDDDDVWLKGKLKSQIDEMVSIYERNELVASFTSLYTYLKKPTNMFILPRKKYEINHNMGDYLFELNLGRWSGWVQTSTIMASRETFLKVPFDPLLPKHQDWEWILKVNNLDIPIIHVDVPYSIYHKNNNNSVAQIPRWQFSAEWIEKWRNKISIKAYENFQLSVVANGISKDNSLTLSEKVKYILRLRKSLSFKTKLSVASFRFLLQYLYNLK